MSDYTIPKAIDFDNMSQKARASIDWAKGIKQAKIDGCACRIDVTGSIKVAVSASNKVVKSIDHILDKLPPGHYTLCGEVHDSTKWFQEASGDFRRQSASPNLRFTAFDGCIHGEGELPYTARREHLIRALPAVDWVISWPCHDLADVTEYAKALKQADEGRVFDGAIWRNPDAPFECGRSKGDIIKVKPLLSLDLLCIGAVLDKGEKTGRDTLSLVLKYKGREQKVSTGLTHEQQAFPTQFIDQIIEVEAMGLTKGGLLREPRFKAIRHDKLNPDE